MALPAVVGAALSGAGASEATALAAEAATAAGLKGIGSAAGLAQRALAACRQELADFSRGVGVAALGLTAAATAVQVAGREISQAVGKFSPGAVTRFTLASDNLTASIGRLLLPVLERLTPVVQTLADAFASLRPRGAVLVGAAAAAGAALGVAAAAAAAFAAAVSVAFGGLPLVVGAVAGGMAGLTFVLKDTAEVTRVARTAADEFVRVLNVMGAVAKVLLPGLESAASGFGRLAKAVSDQLVRAVLVAAPALEQVGGAVVTVLDALADAMGPLQPVFDKAAGVVSRFVGTVTEWVGDKLAEAVGLVADLAPGLESLVESVGELLGSGFEFVAEVFDQLVESVGGLVGGAEGLNEVLKDVAGVVRFVAREVLPALTSGITKTIYVVAGVLDILYQVLKALVAPARQVAQALAGLFSSDNYDREGVPEDRYSRSFKPGAAEGMAVRGVSSGDQMSAIRRAQEAAFGSGQRPEVQTAKGVTSMAKTLENIEKGVERLPESLALKLATFIANNVPGVQTAGRVVNAANDVSAWAARQYVATVTGL